MKKRMLIFAAAALAAFTACGMEENLNKTGAQAENGVSEEGTGPTVQEAVGDGEALTVHEYEPDIIRYGEPAGMFSFRKDVEKTQTDCASYYFETSIGGEERRACIEATDRALSCIDVALPEIEIAVFTGETLDAVIISGNRLYIPIQSWDTADYLAKVLLAGYGEWANYGLAYGYADYLCGKTGMSNKETDQGGREKGELLLADIPEAYDLTLLCFHEQFVSEKDVEAAENNARLFVNEYLLSHSEEELLELLSASGTVEGVGRANEALEGFYAEHGVECSLTEIRYAYGGVTFDYAAACEYADFYVDKEWQEVYWEANAKISEDFLHVNYAEVKTFFECNARQMEQYQEFFDFPQYNDHLQILFTNNIGMSSNINGVYYPENHTIYLRAVMSLMHEYIHSVMYAYFDWETLWKREGSARYFEHKYNVYYSDFYDGMAIYYGDDAHAQEVFDSLGSFLGRAPDIRIDFQAIADISGYIWGNTDPNTSYDAASSFVGYLVDQYGERAVVSYICSEDEYNAEWGRSYEELVQEWNEYIRENYSWYERK